MYSGLSKRLWGFQTASGVLLLMVLVLNCSPADLGSPQEVVRVKCAGYSCRGVKNSTSVSARNSSHPHSTSSNHAKPSKFDENIEDTIPVDIGENGTLIPDYDAKDKVGTIVLTKDEGLEDPPPVLHSNVVMRKKFISRGKKKALSSEESVVTRGTNTSINAEPTEKVNVKDVEGDFGTRLEKRKSMMSKNVTVTVTPPVTKRRTSRPKRSPIQFYDDRPYYHGYGGNKQRRYVRFPIPDFPSTGVGSFRPSRPLWGPNNHYTDSLIPRSPRLVFRDPVEPGTLQAPFFNQGGNLQDLSAPEENRGCGVSVVKQQGAQRRIVGGDEAGFGSFPWQAYIRIGSSRCGGTLVNKFHVVTAGHCVARASARQVQVTLGDYVINSAVEPLPAYTFGVRKISVHPYFKFTPQADRFDVAVLRLDRPVQYMPHIAPICLPEKGEDFLGQFGWAAGWGALQAGSRLRPKTLQAVNVPIIDNRLCERWHKSNGINVVIYDEMMCAGYRGGGKDSCQGDSGGPLMMEKGARWFLIGIVSAGYSCAQRGQPGIYHRVAHTVDWISYIINS